MLGSSRWNRCALRRSCSAGFDMSRKGVSLSPATTINIIYIYCGLVGLLIDDGPAWLDMHTISYGNNDIPG